MKLLILLCALFAIALSAPFVYKGTPDQQFEQFKAQYNRHYKSSHEEKLRKEIFKKNLQIAQKMTLDAKGKTFYGINQFIDLSPEEFRHQYLMPKDYVKNIAPKYAKYQFPYVLKNVTVPKEGIFDWRFPKAGYDTSCVSPVYNQGQCGSCWAFSATEQTEAMTCLGGSTGGSYIQNSMQQVVSCDGSCDGCGGGFTISAYQYIVQAGGQDSYASYPYTAEDTSCAFNPSTIQSRITNYGYVGQNDESVMQNYVLGTGPLSVCVDAASWQYYNGGVIQSCGTQIDHCVQITGYGSVSGINAWVVRNSWGTGWGYGGYLYVAYGGNVCGISEYPSTVAAN